jgi:hypothetical protein
LLGHWGGGCPLVPVGWAKASINERFFLKKIDTACFQFVYITICRYDKNKQKNLIT